MSQPDQHFARVLRQQVAVVAVFAMLSLVVALAPLQNIVVPGQLYLPLHATLEFLSASAAFLVFATVWHTPARETSSVSMWIATALLAAGWMDLAHTLSFPGMPDFITPASVEKGIGFWLVARVTVSVTLIAVSFFPHSTPLSQGKRHAIIGLYSAINLAFFILIIYFPQALPRTFIEGRGLTAFKVVMELAITGMLALAAARFYLRARSEEDEFPALLFGAVGIAALSELYFAWYQSPNDIQNLTGHIYKIVSYALIYRAMFVTSIHKPYEQLAAQAEHMARVNETLRTQALALDSTVAPVVVADVDGTVRWRNRVSYQILPDDVVDGRSLSLFAPPVTSDAVVAESMRSVLMAGDVWRGTVEILDGQGRPMFMSRTITPLCGGQGGIEGFVSVSEDVTETLRLQQRYKRVLDSAIDGFWIMDTQGRLLTVNRAFARMVGYGVDELLGMNLRQLEAVEDEVAVKAHMEKIMRTGLDQFETWHRHKDGREIQIEISTTFDKDLQQFFVFARDITERVQAADAQRDLERQLQQAQKMEALGQLTGGIAHDFNNILASVLGYSKLALDRLVPDKESKLARYLSEIITASERARDLIAKMLAFSRTQPTRRSDPMTPAVVIKEVQAMIRPSIPSSIGLEVRIADDPSIRMDPGELNQILVNLIINARDAIEVTAHSGAIGIHQHVVEGGGRVCAISRQRLVGPYLAIEVSDSGSGIAPEHMPRLFDPFFTTKEVGKGSGLGLPMVQGILRRSGGHIVVDSRPGQGSVFQLLFPLSVEVEAAESGNPIARCGLDGDGECIWVVEDEPAIAGYMAELLEGHGYHVCTFSQPDEVLSQLDGEATASPHLLITDKTMPGMSGLELAAHLHQTYPDLPVIMCTGYSSGGDQQELPPSIRRCFIKPVTEDELLAAVAAELGRGSSENPFKKR